MVKLQALHNLAKAALAGAALCLFSASTASAVSVTFSTSGGNVTARTITYTDDGGSGFTADLTAYDLRVTGDAADGELATTSQFGEFFAPPFVDTPEQATFDIYFLTGNCVGGAPCLDNDDVSGGDANTLNQSPSHDLGLDGTQAQNFIGYGEAIQVDVSGLLTQISSITFYEKSDSQKDIYIFDSQFAFVDYIVIDAGVGKSAGDFFTATNINFTNADPDGVFYIVGGNPSGSANDGFTLSSLTLGVVPVPPAVYMFPAALALFGFFGYRRRRNAA